MRLVDKSCWERGCACHDDRVDKESVAIVKQRTWVGLTQEDIDEAIENNQRFGGFRTVGFAYDLEAKLKEKNT